MATNKTNGKAKNAKAPRQMAPQGTLRKAPAKAAERGLELRNLPRRLSSVS